MRWIVVAFLLMARLAPATVFTPAVDTTCSTDVTARLNAFFAGGVANGTAAARNTVQLKGCYRIDGTVTVPQRSFLTIQGPAELRAVAAMAPNGSRALLRLDRGHDLAITDLVLRGTNPDDGAYVGTLEHEYGLQISGSSHIRLDRLTLRNVHGDGLTINPGGTWDANGMGATIADDVLLENSMLFSTGRHGVTCTACSNLRILRNTFDYIGYLGIDQEIEAPAWYARGTLVADNTFGRVRIGAFSASGFQIGPFVVAQTDGITIAHNRVLGPLATCIAPIGFTTGSNPTNVTILANDMPAAIGSPFFVGGGRHVLIAANHAAGNSCGAGGAGVTLDGGDDITIDGNAFSKAPAAWRTDPDHTTHVPTGVTAMSNTCVGGVCPAGPGL